MVEKNKIKPTEVSIGSHKKVIWRCEKGHEWEAAVKSRTINKTDCPYCSHNKVLAGFNDLILFDWEGDGESDHVGIVEKVENGIVYTVEGNSGDSCRINQYSVGNYEILGYGVPQY